MKRHGIVLAFLGVFCIASAQPKNQAQQSAQKVGNLIQLIQYMYVDTVDLEPISEKGIVEILKQLDPHSQYISAKDLQKANEPLEGNFDGIGVSFQIVKDTIVIVDVIIGGPSEKLGILAGDKIVKIDTLKATGDSANNDFVFRHLRGKKGTEVEILIVRKGANSPLSYKVVRDKIPIHSVDTYFMENDSIGYIRIERFAKNTMLEFTEALKNLKTKGMQNLILDLRGNGGGYMDMAVQLSEQFLESGQLVVYAEGKAQPRQDFVASEKGSFKKGKLIILIDESSASASEIVSGAVQDWDRGLIVGRRSFGKGLVQRPFDLPDGSNVRLTTARYYTPSGRCVQKPYEDGLNAYFSDIMNRYAHGQMLHPDSVKIPDSLRYKTSSGRFVYGGGGIMPDVFIPIDTQRASDYYVDLRRKNVLNNFVMDLMDKDRLKLLKKYPDFKTFNKDFQIDDAYFNKFKEYAEKEGVKPKNFRSDKAVVYVKQMVDEMTKDSALLQVENYEEYMEKSLWSTEKMKDYLLKKAKEEDDAQLLATESSNKYLKAQIKALIARNLYGISSYFEVVKDVDQGYQRAVELMKE